MTRNQREPRFGQGRRRDESSSSSLSGDRGRRHRDGPGGRGQQPSTLDKLTPVLMQRKSSGGAGGSSSEEGTARPTGRQPSRQHRNVDKKSKDMVDSQHDDFSAALQALPKMKQASATTGESASSSTSPSQVVHGDADRGREKHGSKKQHSHGKGDDRKREKDNQPPSSPKKDKKRDLSPSVAAIFDAVSASQQQHSSSDVLSDDTDSHGEGGPSAALKSMLNIQGTQAPVHVASTRAPPPPSTSSSSSTTTGMLNPRIPDALQKLFRGPAPPPSAVPTSGPHQAALMRGIPPPRGPLLPYPGYQQIPPPQIPLGGEVLDYYFFRFVLSVSIHMSLSLYLVLCKYYTCTCMHIQYYALYQIHASVIIWHIYVVYIEHVSSLIILCQDWLFEFCMQVFLNRCATQCPLDHLQPLSEWSLLFLILHRKVCNERREGE